MTFQPGRTKTGGRQKGTPNKNKPFKAALDEVLAEAKGDAPTLKSIVSTLLTQANAGNTMAIKEVADRLDGKVPQTVSDAEGNVLQPVAALLFADNGEIPSSPEADRGDEHEGNGSSVRRRSRRR
jgi:hypothetical protein